jgi:hypothetical protein
MPLVEPGPDGYLMGGAITLRGYLFEVVYRSVGLFLGRGDLMVSGHQTTCGELYLYEGSENDKVISYLEAPDLRDCCEIVYVTQRRTGSFLFLPVS